MTALPSGWRAETLGDVAAGGLFTDGDWVETKDQDPAGGVRLTQLADVGIGQFRDRSDRWLREDQATRLGCTFLKPDDVLIARMPEPLGRACVVPESIGRAVTVVDVAVARLARADVHRRYLMWAFNSPHVQEQMLRLQSGTTRKRISRRNLATVHVPMPSLAEQRRIVDILEDHLSRLDAAEAYLTASMARSAHLAAAELRRLTHDVPGATARTLADVAEVRLGRQRSPSNHLGPRMRPYLRAANVGWDALRLDDVKQMNFTETEESTYRLLQGDILVVEASGSAGQVGKSALYEGQPAAVCFQNTLLRVRCTDAVPEFIQKYLLADAMSGRFVAGSRGVGINHLGRAKLAAWNIDLPPESIQSRLVSRCNQALAAVDALDLGTNAARVRAQALRRAILAAAFSGQLTGRSSDLDRAEALVT